MNGQWVVHGTRDVYENEWATVSLADVERPDGSRLEHHYVTQPNFKGGAGVLAYDEEKKVLMIWRHRFITDSWTWELPGGAIESDENASTAAKRELLEETGWESSKLTHLIEFDSMNGLVDHRFTFFSTDSATWKGPHADPNEVADIAWLPLDQICSLMKKGDVSDGPSMTALLWAMQFGPLGK